ncbi:MAG: dTDP-4-dehydrorhamnose 3,5-epimerase [Gemmatimonadota bacterium]|nr:dTDP-4-dehydrorhamnose 3,5-epimerase [Gemmatimonadota bacterium]
MDSPVVRIDDPPGPLLFRRTLHRDDRGVFVEEYRRSRYRELGLDARFVQINRSTSKRSVLRGLHFQHPGAQGKLVSVTRGAVFDVAVDIRLGSPSYGRWYGIELSGENGLQLWVPPDFAHGFVTLTEEADLLYGCTAPYDPSSEHTLRWDDPAVGVDWPVRTPDLSPKDRDGLGLETLARRGALPRFGGSGAEALASGAVVPGG